MAPLPHITEGALSASRFPRRLGRVAAGFRRSLGESLRGAGGSFFNSLPLLFASFSFRVAAAFFAAALG
jgi:hypothetical protein